MTAVVQAVVRELLPSEVAFFQEHGWAFLPGLIRPEAAAELEAYAARVTAEQSAYGKYAFQTDGAFSIFRRPDQSCSNDILMSNAIEDAGRLGFLN